MIHKKTGPDWFSTSSYEW